MPVPPPRVGPITQWPNESSGACACACVCVLTLRTPFKRAPRSSRSRACVNSVRQSNTPTHPHTPNRTRSDRRNALDCRLRSQDVPEIYLKITFSTHAKCANEIYFPISQSRRPQRIGKLPYFIRMLIECVWRTGV